MKQAPSLGHRLTAQFVQQSLGVTGITGTNDLEFTAVTTDSRKVPKGSLFVAIRGENFDGHAFIESAFKAGAAGAIGETPKISASSVYFQVPDSLAAFRSLAHHWRKSFEIPIVGVAGSNGKTTSKEFLAALLSGKYSPVWKTQGSQNGFVGIPMTILDMKRDHQAAVIEIGIDEIGAMAKHISLVEPTAAILTSIGPEHLEKLGDVATVAREEAIALERVHRNGGLVAIHLDDPHIRPLWDKLKGGHRLGYTLEGAASGEVYRGELAGARLSITGGRLASPLQLDLPLLGRHNAMNLLGAATLAMGLGLTPDELKRGLSSFQGAPGRSQVRELPDGTVFLCDYYNASPPSVAAGLDLLSELASARKRRRFACLADMKELGPDEETFHRGLAPKILSQKIENVLLFGDRMKHLYDELKRGGFKGERLEHFSSRQALADRVIENLKPGDAVLIKGSHSLKMEEVYEHLRAHLKLP